MNKLSSSIVRLDPVQLREKLCFFSALPNEAPCGDDTDNVRRSRTRLFENGFELGPAHSVIDEIADKGQGRFSHWQNWVYFSSSDGTDPRTNGYEYHALCSPPLGQLGQRLEDLMHAELDRVKDADRYTIAEELFGYLVPSDRIAESGRSFFLDKNFLRDFQAFEPHNFRSYDRKFALKELFKVTDQLAGDVAECGVYRGGSAYLLAKHLRLSSSSRTLHLFDSFEGVSEPDSRVDGSFWKKGLMSVPLSEVQERLNRFSDMINYFPGWIPDRFDEVAHKRFSFVHIDVDLYQPTRDSLQFFGDRMQPGGLLVCDDYGFETCPGARQGMDEFAQSIGTPIVHLPTGQGVLFFK